jgi:hypothetical protein
VWLIGINELWVGYVMQQFDRFNGINGGDELNDLTSQFLREVLIFVYDNSGEDFNVSIVHARFQDEFNKVYSMYIIQQKPFNYLVMSFMRFLHLEERGRRPADKFCQELLSYWRRRFKSTVRDPFIKKSLDFIVAVHNFMVQYKIDIDDLSELFQDNFDSLVSLKDMRKEIFHAYLLGLVLEFKEELDLDSIKFRQLIQRCIDGCVFYVEDLDIIDDRMYTQDHSDGNEAPARAVESWKMDEISNLINTVVDHRNQNQHATLANIRDHYYSYFLEVFSACCLSGSAGTMNLDVREFEAEFYRIVFRDYGNADDREFLFDLLREWLGSM